MSLKYHLVERKNMAKGAPSGSKLFYAQTRSDGTVSLDELCTEISDGSTVNSADVKAVLDRLNYVTSRHLQNGRIVQLGELGNFRMTVGSKGSTTEAAFDASTMMRKPKVLFHAGSKLQQARKTTTFERILPLTKTVEATPGG